MSNKNVQKVTFHLMWIFVSALYNMIETIKKIWLAVETFSTYLSLVSIAHKRFV